MEEFKQLLNDLGVDGAQRSPAALCLFPDMKKQRMAPRGRKVKSQRKENVDTYVQSLLSICNLLKVVCGDAYAGKASHIFN